MLYSGLFMVSLRRENGAGTCKREVQGLAEGRGGGSLDVVVKFLKEKKESNSFNSIL